MDRTVKYCETVIFTTEEVPVDIMEPPAEPAPPAPTSHHETAPVTTIIPLPDTSSPMQLLPPVPPPPPRADAPVPAVSQLPGIQNWVIYLFGGLILAMILTLLIILAMVLKMRRL